jgi:hypothetical protein
VFSVCYCDMAGLLRGSSLGEVTSPVFLDCCECATSQV